MGRKSSSKGQTPTRPAQPPVPKKGLNPLLLGAVAVGVVAVAVLAMRGGDGPTASTPAGSEDAQNQLRTEPTAEHAARAESIAKFGPRQQTNLPPIPFQAFAPPRPVEVVTAAYQFAAEHPEVLSYVPCFCGCELSGHDGNHDCFVKSRDENGNVIAWDEHGVECTVCIDVANRSRQMYASGATVRGIREAIEKEFGPVYPGHTPTPNPPSASAAAAADEHAGHD